MTTAKELRSLHVKADLSHIHTDIHVLAMPISALSGHPDKPRKHPGISPKYLAVQLQRASDAGLEPRLVTP